MINDSTFTHLISKGNLPLTNKMNSIICSCKKHVTKAINNNHTFGYKGGTFTNHEIIGARHQKNPLTMDCALPGTCLNNCTFCGFLSVNKQDKLEPHDRFCTFDEFAALGGKSIKILGEGEPLLRKDILSLVKWINYLGMTPVLFTCGDTLGSDELARKIHGCSCDEIVQNLYDTGVTVVLKYEKRQQDDIVQRQGYSTLRDKALERLLCQGFNKHSPSRIGFAIVLLRENFDEIPTVFEFALDNNIYPLVCPVMPIGKMKHHNAKAHHSPSCSEINILARRLVGLRERRGSNFRKRPIFPEDYLVIFHGPEFTWMM